MSPARKVRIYTGAVFFFWIAVSTLFIMAGGLGLAASAGFLGLMWAPMLVWPALIAIRARPPALIAFMAFIGFAVLSLAWSPYERPDQALKLALLTPLFMLVPFAIARLDAPRRLRFAAFTAIMLLVASAYFVVESLFGAPVAHFVKASSGEAPAGPDALGLAHRTLSRGASAFILVAGPMVIWLWSRTWRIAAGMLALSVMASALAFNMDANIAALAAGVLLAAAAYLNPRFVLPGLFYAAAALVALTPILLGAIVASTPDDLANMLPLSWHQRLEIWRYALARLAEAPLFGLGLDGSRMLEDMTMLRGYPLALVPLHPHNGALHIWVETGAVGAGLAAAALLLTGRTLAHASPAPAVAAGLAFCATVWFMLTLLGYGVWQEWHHGALSLAVAACFFSQPGEIGDTARHAFRRR